MLLAVVAGLIALARGVRRRRRQRTGPASRRLAEGWRDYVDHARDLGFRVPAGLTRKEQSALVGRPDLAAEADAAVFGYGEPERAQVDGYWAKVAAGRKDLTKVSSSRRRLLHRLSVRGLLFRDARPVERQSKATSAGANRRRILLLRKARA